MPTFSKFQIVDGMYSFIHNYIKEKKKKNNNVFVCFLFFSVLEMGLRASHMLSALPLRYILRDVRKE
jgi:hypothetical protein